jgi:hypothetical protein
MTIHTLSPQGSRLTIPADQESMKYEKGGKQRPGTHANKGSGLINER